VRCSYCNSELIWNNDFSFEDYGYEGEGIVSVLTYSNEECSAYVEAKLSLDEVVEN